MALEPIKTVDLRTDVEQEFDSLHFSIAYLVDELLVVYRDAWTADLRNNIAGDTGREQRFDAVKARIETIATSINNNGDGLHGTTLTRATEISPAR